MQKGSLLGDEIGVRPKSASTFFAFVCKNGQKFLRTANSRLINALIKKNTHSGTKVAYTLVETEGGEPEMEGQRIREIISILMESPLYFGFSVSERRELIRRLMLISV